MLAFALAVAFGAVLRRTLPAIGAVLAGFTVLLLAARRAVLALTPASKTAGQYWPLQLILLTVLLALAAGALATGWHATRTRAV